MTLAARPWCDSPQPTRPSSVVTFTTTASRLTARPMPSRAPPVTGKERAKAWTSAIAMPFAGADFTLAFGEVPVLGRTLHPRISLW